jgi:hypothetical protein
MRKKSKEKYKAYKKLVNEKSALHVSLDRLNSKNSILYKSFSVIDKIPCEKIYIKYVL